MCKKCEEKNENLVTCSECGCSLCSVPLRLGLEEDESLCTDCFSKKYSICACCYRVVPKEEAKAVNDTVFCKRCYAQHILVCADCGMEVDRRDTELVHDSTHCTLCGGIQQYCGTYPEGFLHYEDGKIYTGKRQGVVYFGVEQEIEFNLKYEASIKKAVAFSRYPVPKDWGKFGVTYLREFFDIKDDSSLFNGFEVVPKYPYSMAFLHKYKDFFTDFGLYMRKEEAVITSDCGGHINISRETLAERQQRNFLSLIYAEEIKDFLTVWCGRSLDNEYAEFDTYGNKFIKRAVEFNDVETNRDTHCNVQKKVFEFRGFAGVIGYEALAKNIEFCQSLLDFCKTDTNLVWDIGVLDVEGTLQNFNYFLTKNNNTYPNAYSFYEKHKNAFTSEEIQKLTEAC